MKVQTADDKAKALIDVTCAIIQRGEHVLVTQRGERMKMPLKWEFPGGKVEPGESETECLLRELKEELSIHVQIIARLEPQPFHYPEFAIRLIPFVTRFDSGDIMLREHKTFLWLTPDQLGGLDWAAADVPVVESFLRYIKPGP